MSRSRRDRARRNKAAIGSIRCTTLAALTLSESGALPTEVRIWKAGLNTDRNGYNVLFDAKAADMVMSAYREHGVELIWDLEHLSLEDPETSVNYDPDARASCSLEVRNGELWAVAIKWTPDGETRLRNRTQRYPSPAFRTDADGRPTRLFNIALCAMPATDHIEPLVAKEDTEMKITLSQLAAVTKRARALSKAGVDAATIIKTLADGAPGDSSGDVAGVSIPDLAALCGVDIDPGSDPAGFIKALLAKLNSVVAQLGGSAEPAAPQADDPAAMADAPKPEEMAAARLMLKLTGCDNFTDGALRMNEWRGIIANHEAAAKKVADEKAALENTERTALVVRLQKCGAETPATCGLADGKLVKRLAEEPIDAMRERVKQLELAASARASGNGSTAVTVATAGDAKSFVINGKSVEVTAAEMKICAELKCEPQTFAMLKARRAGTVTA